jgi:thiamine monophosphate synthase
MLIGASIRRKEEMELLSAEDVDYVIYGIFTGRGLWASGASGDSSIFDGLQSLFPIPVISVCDNISSAEGILKSDVAGIAVHPHGHPGDESPESLVSGYRSLLDKWKAS